MSNVKLIVLKTGERIITEAKEYVDDQDRVRSVVFIKPMLVDFLTPELLVEDPEDDNDIVEHRVAFMPWQPLSKNVEFAISPDHIATICDPIDWIVESYTNKMKGNDPTNYGEPVDENKTLRIEDEDMIDTTLDSIEVTGELLNE